MQSHTPKQPIPPPRDRPLQKSMFLPEHYPPTPPLHPQQSNEHPPYGHLKRSLMQNTGPGTGNQYQFRTGANNNVSFNTYQPPTATHAPFAHLDSRAGSHHQLLQHSNSTSNMKHSSSFHRVDTPVEYEFKNFSKNDKMRTSGIENTDNKNVVNEVVSQLKEKYLPSLFAGFKLQFKEQMNQLRQQLVTLKEDMKNHRIKQQQINNQMRNNMNSNKLNDSSDTRRSSFTERDQQINELQKDFFLLEGKIKQIESKMGQGFTLLADSVKSISNKIDQPSKFEDKFSVSAIKSQLPAVMLEYKQMFFVKMPGEQRKKGEEEIILSACHYYVDKNGYLMDNQNRYLVNQKGSQVRLDEKHLKLLERHKILHR